MRHLDNLFLRCAHRSMVGEICGLRERVTTATEQTSPMQRETIGKEHCSELALDTVRAGAQDGYSC